MPTPSIGPLRRDFSGRGERGAGLPQATSTLPLGSPLPSMYPYRQPHSFRRRPAQRRSTHPASVDWSTVVIDVSEACASPVDLSTWEKKHGKSPAGYTALVRTGWSARWPDKSQIASWLERPTVAITGAG